MSNRDDIDTAMCMSGVMPSLQLGHVSEGVARALCELFGADFDEHEVYEKALTSGLDTDIFFWEVGVPWSAKAADLSVRWQCCDPEPHSAVCSCGADLCRDCDGCPVGPECASRCECSVQPGSVPCLPEDAAAERHGFGGRT